MSIAIQTAWIKPAPVWEDGSKKSIGNAFDWQAAKTDAQIKAEQAKARRAAQYARKLEREGRSKVGIAEAKATRVNREASLAAFVPSSDKAPR